LHAWYFTRNVKEAGTAFASGETRPGGDDAQREFSGPRLRELIDRPASRNHRDVRDGEVAEQQARDDKGRQERRPIAGVQQPIRLHQQQQAEDEPPDGAK